MLDNYIRGFAISKQRAFALAAKLGAEIEDYGTSIELDAPKGKIFDDTHHRNYDTFYSRAGVWATIIEDLAGLSDCKIADCEMCQQS